MSEAVFLLPLLVSVLWGLAFATLGRAMQDISASTWIVLAALVQLCLGLLLHLSGRDAISVRGLAGSGLGITIAAFAASALAEIMSYYTIKYASATHAALGEVSYPIFVPLFAWLLFRENQLTLPVAIGGGLILAGLAVIMLGQLGQR